MRSAAHFLLRGRGVGRLAAMLGITTTLGCSGAERVAPPPGPELTDDDLRRVAQRRIWFGHQSVGGNVLEGVRRATDGKAGAPRIVQLDDPKALAAGVLGHALVGSNRDPRSKIRAFEKAIDGGLGGQADVAFFKLCYVDVDAATDVEALFRDYEATMRGLAARHPRTRFVHVTVPLTTTQDGLKARIKKSLGRAVWGEVENLRRGEFNERLRRAFAAEPIFDLARLESTRPDGTRHTALVQGRAVEVLLPGYTDDGGHLNAAAGQYVARHLLKLLAGLG